MNAPISMRLSRETVNYFRYEGTNLDGQYIVVYIDKGFRAGDGVLAGYAGTNKNIVIPEEASQLEKRLQEIEKKLIAIQKKLPAKRKRK